MKYNIKTKILINATVVALLLAVVLMIVMIFSMKSSTNSIILDVIQPMTKTASQSIEGDIHILADRIFMIGDISNFTDDQSTIEDKQRALENAKSGIEFVWLGLYTPDGKFYVGSEESPSDISSREMFSLMNETQNLVVDDVTESNNSLEIAIGTPILKDGKVEYYLVGSYKYDILNDVLSNINIGANSEAFILKKDGSILGYKDIEIVKQKKNIYDFVDENESAIINRIVSGETNSSSIGKGGNAILVGYSPIRGTNWYLSIFVPIKDFMLPVNRAILISILVTIILLILAAILTIRFSKKIQKSLENVTGRLGLLAEGDLKTTTQIIKTEDEVQILSEALSDTISSINKYISELSRVISKISEGNFDVSVEGQFYGDFVVMKESLNNIIDFLNDMMMTIKFSALDIASTSNMVSDNAQKVYNGSTEQSNSLKLLTDEAKAIEDNIEEVDKNTQLANSLMAEVMESLKEGDENMGNLLSAMQEITKNSQEITKINKFLEDIAFQTNILAINASIEASHAGEAGRGFAVVASEVRELAAKSTESSNRTEEMVRRSLETIRIGSSYAQKMAETFATVENFSNNISDITDKLTVTVNVQKQSLSNISSQISQINAFAEENLNSSHESSTASQKLNSQAEGLKNIAEGFIVKSMEGNQL